MSFEKGGIGVKVDPEKPVFKKVMKFGGTSLGSPENIAKVCGLIATAAEKERVAVVVSAMAGVTDNILAGDYAGIEKLHSNVAQKLGMLGPLRLLQELKTAIKKAKRCAMAGISKEFSMDHALSFGERLSARLVADYLLFCMGVPAVDCDAREFVRTDNRFGEAAVDFKETEKLIKQRIGDMKVIPVITGFIGATSSGETTTLGRGGSDYTAAIVGAALNVGSIEIWTDVDGVMTADPRIVPDAVTLPGINYEEAFEMANFGAKVIHPATMFPAIQQKIPIFIKNTFNPQHLGTCISCRTYKDPGAVKNVSVIPGIRLLNLRGPALVGVPGMLNRATRALAEKRINIVFISQASSEHTISLAVREVDAVSAMSVLSFEFVRELAEQKICIDEKADQSIISIVGAGMKGLLGTAGKFFSVFGEERVNISAIAQGISEQNISCVIDEINKVRAVKAVHREFVSRKTPVGVFLFGLGNVGREFACQISSLPEREGVALFGVANSRRMFVGKERIDPDSCDVALKDKGEETDFGKFLDRAREVAAEERVFVDCTASEEIAKSYPTIIERGFHIVAANKLANVLPMENYIELRHIARLNRKFFKYSANVGAGLPIISAIRRLMSAGDEITKIEGIFSGTLGWLFSKFNSQVVSCRIFSKLVQEARDLGYTEPDPRDDLSGKDVARKLLILAREMGKNLNLVDVRVKNLCLSDDYFTKKIVEAGKRGSVLRYVGVVSPFGVFADLQIIPRDHPFAAVRGSDNVVAIHTKNYPQPIIIRGPGAGNVVTAAAVLADVMEIASTLNR